MTDRPDPNLPWLGSLVYYRAKTRGYTLPAIVTATKDTLDPEGVRLGHVPPLDSMTHVHLHVLTAGEAGCYAEHNVPAGEGPGTWAWPTGQMLAERIAAVDSMTLATAAIRGTR